MKNRNHFIKAIACLFFIMYSISSFGALTVTLTASNHNGYSISCTNGTDGSITSSVSNGTAPYTYRWSTGATTANISSLPSGLYQVTVTDASTATAVAQITLTQPRVLNVVLTPSQYNGEYNISCYNCCNGYINSTVSDGVSPYTYLWATSATTANITALCEGSYLVTVTDHNGCTKGIVQTMLQPDRADWTISGNSNSTPGTNFIGTSDNKDFVFKTNNAERMRINANGSLKISSFTGTGDKFIYADNNGVLQSFNFKIIPPQVTQPCNANNYTYVPNVWQYDNSNFTNLFNCWQNFGIGTSNPQTRLEVKGDARFTNYQSSPDYINIGHDGANARINSFGAGSLLINYSDNTSPTIPPPPTRDTYINTGPSSGDVHLGNYNKLVELSAMNIKMPYLANNGSGSNGVITLNSAGLLSRITGNNNQVVLGDGTLGNISGINFWTLNGNNDIYNNNSSGNVGIGTTAPNQKLEVMNGIARFSNDGSGGGAVGNVEISFDGAHGRITSTEDLMLNYDDANPSTGHKVIVGGRLDVLGSNLALGNNDGRNYNGGIAMVHSDLTSGQEEDQLILNYGGFYRGGVKIDGGQTSGIILDAGTQGIKIPALQAATGTTSVLQIDDNGKINAVNTTAAGLGFWQQSATPGKIYFNDWVGIGSGSNPPISPLFVNGDSYIGGELRLNANSSNTSSDIGVIKYYNSTMCIESKRAISLYLDEDADENNEAFWIWKNRTPGAPGTTADLLFKVNEAGIASAKAMKVTAGVFPDYVFNNDYKLMPLEVLAEYIKTHKHLPEVPTADDVEKNDLDLGDISTTLVKKVEELTLYIINLEKENRELNKKLENLDKKLSTIDDKKSKNKY